MLRLHTLTRVARHASTLTARTTASSGEQTLSSLSKSSLMQSTRSTPLSKSVVSFPRVNARPFSSAAEADLPQVYSLGTRFFHWSMGGGMMACTGLVLTAMNLPDWKDCTPEEKEKKMQLMNLHKSIGVCMLALIVPRIGWRLLTKAPAAPAGNALEKLAGHASHLALYGFAIVLPVTGFTMGYMGGNGLPFFGTKIKPASGEFGKAKDGKLAGQAFKLHKQAGQAFEYFLPLHVGAVGFHYVVKGQNLLTRIIGFGSAAARA